MPWVVRFGDEFESEFAGLSGRVQDELLAQAGVLARFGPQTGRPRVDTLKGSRHPNMKELRFSADGGVWRVAFAFDPLRQAVLLAAGDKSGARGRMFYQMLIRRADARLDAHLKRLGTRG